MSRTGPESDAGLTNQTMRFQYDASTEAGSSRRVLQSRIRNNPFIQRRIGGAVAGRACRTAGNPLTKRAFGGRAYVEGVE